MTESLLGSALNLCAPVCVCATQRRARAPSAPFQTNLGCHCACFCLADGRHGNTLQWDKRWVGAGRKGGQRAESRTGRMVLGDVTIEGEGNKRV